LIDFPYTLHLDAVFCTKLLPIPIIKDQLHTLTMLIE